MSDLRTEVENALLWLISVETNDGVDGHAINSAKGILLRALEQPQQEPVAYMLVADDKVIHLFEADAEREKAYKGWYCGTVTPLYTHPSNVRRLSDDEIDLVVCDFIGCSESVHVDDLVPMIKAIMDACNIPKGDE